MNINGHTHGNIAQPHPGRTFPQAIQLVLAENRHVLEKIDHASVESLAKAILEAERIFVAGEGRSGLAIRMVAMRLMHLGRQVHVVGETTTPSLRKGDLFLVCSGSGKTGTVAILTTTAKNAGAMVVAITAEHGSPVASAAHLVVRIEAAAKQDLSGIYSKQFAGSLFEQAALLLFDAMFHVLSRRLEKDPRTLWRQHANAE
jgi:6-phospho-3-hexuloisomerase